MRFQSFFCAIFYDCEWFGFGFHAIIEVSNMLEGVQNEGAIVFKFGFA